MLTSKGIRMANVGFLQRISEVTFPQTVHTLESMLFPQIEPLSLSAVCSHSSGTSNTQSECPSKEPQDGFWILQTEPCSREQEQEDQIMGADSVCCA